MHARGRAAWALQPNDARVRGGLRRADELAEVVFRQRGVERERPDPGARRRVVHGYVTSGDPKDGASETPVVMGAPLTTGAP